MNKKGSRKLTIIVMPDGGPETRTIRIPYKWLRVLAAVASVLAFALTVMAGSWWYLAARASRVADLELQLQAVAGDRVRVQTLARQLETIDPRIDSSGDELHFGRCGQDLWFALQTVARTNFDNAYSSRGHVGSVTDISFERAVAGSRSFRIH